ncbi:hypothetical protein, partial [Enterobacter hormaechei]|uniref:hypothetical protein n=1 Tax=Enterobacter hormaechei TaxID=158836 RepID=UPI001C8F944A
ADRNRSHWSTSKTPSYTKSVSWQHHQELNAFKFDWEEIQNKAFAVACGKSIGEGASIATMFLCWKAIHLLDKQEG